MTLIVLLFAADYDDGASDTFHFVYCYPSTLTASVKAEKNLYGKNKMQKQIEHIFFLFVCMRN